MDNVRITIEAPDGQRVNLDVPMMAYEINGMQAFGNVLNQIERAVKAFQQRSKAR